MAKETRLLNSVRMIQVYKADTRWTWARASVEREDVVISGQGGLRWFLPPFLLSFIFHFSTYFFKYIFY